VIMNEKENLNEKETEKKQDAIISTHTTSENITQTEPERKRILLQNFDYYWRILLMVILLVALVYMFAQWRQIDSEAMTCKNQPFVWGAVQLEKYYNTTIDCSCFLGYSTLKFNSSFYEIKGKEFSTEFNSIPIKFLNGSN